MPNEVGLSVSIGVGGCWWTISLSAVHICIMVFPLWKRDPSLDYASYSMT